MKDLRSRPGENPDDRGPMGKRRIAMAALLMTAGAACSEPQGLTPVPDWARNTQWEAKVTMQSGAVLVVTLTMEEQAEGLSWAGVPGILRNQATGAGIESWGMAHYGTELLSLYFVEQGGVMLDGPRPACTQAAGHFPRYLIDASWRATGEFHGTIRHHCFPAGVTFEELPMILRRR